MLLKEIGRKIAQAFRLARAADEKVASSIAAALDAKAEQIKEYEKRFEPEHPEPEPLPMQQVIQSLAAYGFSTDEAACAIAKAMAQKPKLLRNLTNNWRKMHRSGEGGKAMEQESRVNNPKPWIAQLFCRHHGEWFRRQEPYFNLSGETQYKVCTKCGKKLDERFIPNFDGS